MSELCQYYQSILLGMWRLLRHVFCDFILLLVHPSFFFSSKSILPGSFSLDKEQAYIDSPIRRCFVDPIRLMKASHLT